MSSAPKSITNELMSAGSAANADQLGEAASPEAGGVKSIEATGGWDAYEVWRRFIKDARDRRKNLDSN